jgi:aryl-alcohol dehydrogenase-like predicted oxidoreductase
MMDLVLGTMNFGKRTGEKESTRIVDAAIDHGITSFDTANNYNGGESERVLGRALKGRRAEFSIATKVGLDGAPVNKEGLGYEAIIGSVERSLERLGTEYIDLLYFHAPDAKTPLADSLIAVKHLLEQGKVRAWGLSNFASWQIAEAMQLAVQGEMKTPSLSQVVYNVIIRQIEIEYIAFAQTQREVLRTTVYNPLAGGLLTGKHSESSVPAGSRFESPQYFRRYWTPRLFAYVEELRVIAAREEMTVGDLAYAWLAGRPGVDSILVGPAEVAHLEQAITACQKTLTPGALAAIDELHYAFAGTDMKYAR